jgi:hypothetical protein
MLDLLGSMFALAQESTGEEGVRVITGMLIVGLIFASIVVFGELWHYYRDLRHRRRY